MKFLLSIITILIFAGVNAQSITFRSLRAADSEFEKFSYSNAARLYEASLEEAEDSLYIYQQLALCYRNMNDSKSAEKYLEEVVKSPEIEPQFIYLYAQALASNGKYDQAKNWYKKYQDKAGDDPRAKEKLEALHNLNRFFADSSKFEIKRMPYNSPGLDFSPAIYKEGIVFASSRPNGNEWVRTSFNWDESRFLDLYQVQQGSDQAERFIDHFQTKYHEGPLAFYDNEQKVVFTRNNIVGKRLKKDGEGVTRLKLFFAESDGEGGWTNIQPFKYNSDDYSVGHPAINENGDAMIFSSDMNGGLGESDLYIVFKTGDEWSEPKNLGSEVNTAGKEMFPSLVSNNLYFASDGRGGLGGLDIFEAGLDLAFEVVSVNNIGYPINSRKDDFGLVSNDNFRSGYFSSARIDSLKDDIYYFERDYYVLKGLALNEDTNEPLPGVDVFVKSEEGELIYRRSDENGEFRIEDISPDLWNVSGVKNTFNLVAEERVTIKEEDDVERLVKIYFSPQIIYPVDFPASITDFITTVDDLENPISNRVRNHSADSLIIKPIYYDFDESKLLVAGKEELDNLIIFMQLYPELIIALSSHTDSRGDEDYNLLLSQRRANAAFEYLVEKGVKAEMLQPTGRGESMPAVECGNCSEKQHQANRRTEFLIVGSKD
ncbi:Tetratricopeptide repeat-containing protein [Ekhidna lutea]|uniref:Tetratricopeptide repeat-containing protein n=1 Tax=Ekhidna lutea TaxID=447679 RepID=A0A239LVF2_EKHLU|nr:OmpA family protein [Ekhidna lutea]SNT34230.1 Tetratricopeptide repeat-containing protein [Ekhidna lutea]